MKRKKFNYISLISPWFLAIVSTLLGLLFTSISPSFYESIIRERNYMYFNPKLFLFVLICLIFFIIGSKIGYKVFINKNIKINEQISIHTKNNKNVTVTILLFIILINFISLINIVVRFDVLTLLNFNSVNGRELRVYVSNAISSSMLGWVRPLSLALLLWCYWDIYKIKNKKKGIRILYIITVILFLLNISLSFTRGPFFAFFIMITSIILLIKHFQFRLTGLYLIKLALVLLTILFGIFITIQVIRFSGTHTEVSLYEVILGYFPASYNRLAAILEGILVMPNSNSAFYTTQFFWDFPFLSRSLDLYNIGIHLGLNLPNSAYENWVNQFWAMDIAGLNRNYIWGTIFGFVFSDYGWFSPVWFYFYGSIAGFTYCQFIKGNTFGIIIYPFFIFSIVQWVSTIIIASRDIVIFCIAFLFVILLKLIFIKKN